MLQWAAAAACRSDFLFDASELRTGDCIDQSEAIVCSVLANERPVLADTGDASDE